MGPASSRLSEQLVSAASDGDGKAVFRLLRRHEVDVNYRGGHGLPALHVGCIWGHVQVVQLLVQRRDVEINAVDITRRTALNVACYRGHIGVVAVLLSAHGVDLNRRNDDGLTALYSALSRGHMTVARMLLERRETDVNVTNSPQRFSIWDMVVRSLECGTMGRLLLRHNVDLNYVGLNVYSPLQWVCIDRRRHGLRFSLAQAVLRYVGASVGSKRWGQRRVKVDGERGGYRGRRGVWVKSNPGVRNNLAFSGTFTTTGVRV